MVVKNYFIEFETQGKNELINITNDIEKFVLESDIVNGNVLVFVIGSTGGISTIEYEPGLKKDLPELMEQLIPSNKYYHHNETWHDGNGYSHLRATLIGQSLTIPIIEGKLILGTWQQVIFIEFDNKSHRRNIVIQISGQ